MSQRRSFCVTLNRLYTCHTTRWFKEARYPHHAAACLLPQVYALSDVAQAQKDLQGRGTMGKLLLKI